MSLPKPVNEDVRPAPPLENASDTSLAEIGGDLQAAVDR